MIDFNIKIPKHVAGYLAEVLSIPVHRGGEDMEISRPKVSVSCEESSISNGRLWAGDVAVRILSITDRGIDADRELCDEVTCALSDVEAFHEYMMSLEEEARLGWCITKFRVTSSAMEIPSEEGLRDFEITLRVAVMS